MYVRISGSSLDGHLKCFGFLRPLICVCSSQYRHIKFLYFLRPAHWWEIAGADPGFQVRGGALKKIAPSISCEKSRFYAKKSYFFRWRREVRKHLRYFVWKITILRQKIIFFPILGGRAPDAPPPPPGSGPWIDRSVRCILNYSGFSPFIQVTDQVLARHSNISLFYVLPKHIAV